MGELLAFLIVVAAVKKFIADPIIDAVYAARGQDSPRMAAIRQDRAAAGRPARYGAGDYLRDLYSDFWADMRAGREAARKSERESGRRASWRARWRAARAAMGRTARRVAASRPVRKLVDPVEPKPVPDPVAEPAAPEATTAPPEPGTTRFTDTGREQWDGAAWVPVPDKPEPSEQQPQEEPMTAATGEAVNYETAIAQLDAIDDLLGLMDNNVDVLEGERNDVASAAEQLRMSLAALDLDADTMGGVGMLLDFIDPDFVKSMIDKIAGAKVAVATTRAHIIATYGDAANTVAATGVNSGFLTA